MIVTRDFAGADRDFRLGYGEIMDVEEACGGVGIGAIYKRLAAFDWRIGDVFHVLKRGLVGGGMRAAEADRLVRERIEAGRLGELVTLAFDVLIETVDGAPKGPATGSGDVETPIDRGLVYKSFAEVGIAPQEVDAMEFAKVLHLYRAMAKGDKAQPLDPEEFKEMRARVERGELDWSLKPDTKAKDA